MQILLLKYTNLKMKLSDTLKIYSEGTKNVRMKKEDRITRREKSLQSGAFLKVETILAWKPLVIGG